MGVVPTKPWVAQNEWQKRRVQDVELDNLMVTAGQGHGNWGGLVCDCAQLVAIQGPCRDWLRQRDPLELQLLSQLLTNDAGICTRVYQGGQGVGTIRKEKAGLEQRALVTGRLHLSQAHPYLPNYW